MDCPPARQPQPPRVRTDSKRRDYGKRQLAAPGRLQRSRRRLESGPDDAVGVEAVLLVTGRASERSPLRLESSPAAGPRGRGGRPAADSAIHRRPTPVVITYRPWSGALQTRLSSIGSTPRRISARAASRGASLVAESSPIRRPSSRSSQYRVAPAMETMEGRSSFSWKARMRSSPERAGFVRMSFALRGAPCGDDADDTLRSLCGHHRDQTGAVAEADGQEALLAFGVVDIET